MADKRRAVKLRRGVKTRQDIIRLGSYGKTVRVIEAVVRDIPKYRVLWYEESLPRQKDFRRNREGKAEAKAFAEAFWSLRDKEQPSVETVRSIWLAFTRSNDFAVLSDRSKFLYTKHYERWENFIGPNKLVASLTHSDVDEYFLDSANAKKKLGKKRSINQLKKEISLVGLVYRWAKRRGEVASNPLAEYRRAEKKGEKIQEKPGEFTPKEFAEILSQLDPQDPYRWRAASALLLIGETGARISAALQLKRENVEIDGAGGLIRWPKDTNKTRREYLQPLTHGALSALLTARFWQDKRQSKSEYVFPTGQPSRRSEGFLTKSALLSALSRAEARANIPHRHLRGAHGLRRMIATSIATETGNIVAAMQWIGDEDVRQAKSYLERRMSKLEETAQTLSVLGSSGVFAAHLHKLAPKTAR